MRSDGAVTRIAFVSTMDGAPWGGSEQLWSQAAARLARMGYGVGVNVPWWPESVPQLAELRRTGCELERRMPPRGLAHRLARGIRRRLVANDGYPWLDRIEPDLVIISQGWNQDGLGWMEACKRRAVPYATIAQCASEAWWPSDEHATRLAKAYESAAASFFVSEANRALTRAQLASPLTNARLVRNPFNVAYDACPPWPQPAEPLRLACVGRLAPKAKGQDILLEVLRQRKWRERDLALTLFGEGPCKETLKRLARMNGVAHVAFAGVRADVESIWAENHALVLPSRYEGLPLAIVEAMLCGRPCIVTDVAGNAELVEDDVTGFVAAAANAACVDAALERAWANRDSLAEMGRAAAARVRAHVPRDPVATFVEEVLGLLGGTSREPSRTPGTRADKTAAPA